MYVETAQMAQHHHVRFVCKCNKIVGECKCVGDKPEIKFDRCAHTDKEVVSKRGGGGVVERNLTINPFPYGDDRNRWTSEQEKAKRSGRPPALSQQQIGEVKTLIGKEYSNYFIWLRYPCGKDLIQRIRSGQCHIDVPACELLLPESEMQLRDIPE